jgi:hypothetical protein
MILGCLLTVLSIMLLIIIFKVIFDADIPNAIRRLSMFIKFIHPYCYTILSYAILYSPLFVLQIEYITWKI